MLTKDLDYYNHQDAKDDSGSHYDDTIQIIDKTSPPDKPPSTLKSGVHGDIIDNSEKKESSTNGDASQVREDKCLARCDTQSTISITPSILESQIKEGDGEDNESLSTNVDNKSEKKGKEENEDKARVELDFRKRMIVMFGLFLALLLAAMDQTIVAVVLSTIGDKFNALSISTWIATSYLITMTSFQPLYGKLSDIFGRVQVLMVALGIFLIGSVLCGTAQSMIWLIIGRAVTGIGGGGITSMTLVIIGDVTTVKERGRYMGFYFVAWGASSVVGPLLGGVFADKVSWRWCFYINLPICVVTVVTALLFLRIPTESSTWIEKLKRVDFLGSFIVVTALILILLGLSWGGKDYAWNSPMVIAVLTIGLALLVIFVVVEIYIPAEPLVNPSLFKNRTVSAVFVSSMMTGMVMFGLIYYIPIFFSATYHTSAIGSGLRLLPYQVSISIFALLSGQLMTITRHYRTITFVGLAITIVGTGILTLLSVSSKLDKQIGYLILPGIGIGLVLPPTIVIAQAAVSSDMVAVTTNVIIFAQFNWWCPWDGHFRCCVFQFLVTQSQIIGIPIPGLR